MSEYTDMLRSRIVYAEKNWNLANKSTLWELRRMKLRLWWRSGPSRLTLIFVGNFFVCLRLPLRLADVLVSGLDECDMQHRDSVCSRHVVADLKWCSGVRRICDSAARYYINYLISHTDAVCAGCKLPTWDCRRITFRGATSNA